MRLILASSSVYRQAQLQQLGLAFQAISPDIDEAPLPHESAPALVARLAVAKTKAVVTKLQNKQTIVIGSDQVADLQGNILTKPGTHANAVTQLSACSGQTVVFYTGLAVIDAQHRLMTCTTKTTVQFRKLTAAQIQGYLQKEQPYDCAGSFKCEGLGIALFERISSDDPSALIGLPLIPLTHFLTSMGLDPLVGAEKGPA